MFMLSEFLAIDWVWSLPHHGGQEEKKKDIGRIQGEKIQTSRSNLQCSSSVGDPSVYVLLLMVNEQITGLAYSIR